MTIKEFDISRHRHEPEFLYLEYGPQRLVWYSHRFRRKGKHDIRRFDIGLFESEEKALERIREIQNDKELRRRWVGT